MNRTRLLSILSVLACTTGAACLTSEQLRQQQYQADYQQAVQLCGHPDVAFQAGYNAAYAGEPMHGEWTRLCAPYAQAQASTAYQGGFLKGANNAPIHVVHSGLPARSITTTSVAQCTFDSDCGGGDHCRDRECLGHGYAGDRCVFNEDCVTDHCSGRTCRE